MEGEVMDDTYIHRQFWFSSWAAPFSGRGLPSPPCGGAASTSRNWVCSPFPLPGSPAPASTRRDSWSLQENIRKKVKQKWILQDFSKISHDFWGFLRIFSDFQRIFQDFLKISDDFWRILRISDDIWGFLRILSDFQRIFQDFLKISDDFWRILKISDDILGFFWEFLRIFRDFQRILKDPWCF